MKNLMLRFIREEEGQDLVEYAFLIVFIALAVTLVLQATATSINTLFSAVNTGITGS